MLNVIVSDETLCQDLFGGVVYAGLDTDKYKYPICGWKLTIISIQFWGLRYNSGIVFP